VHETFMESLSSGTFKVENFNNFSCWYYVEIRWYPQIN